MLHIATLFAHFHQLIYKLSVFLFLPPVELSSVHFAETDLTKYISVLHFSLLSYPFIYCNFKKNYVCILIFLTEIFSNQVQFRFKLLCMQKHMQWKVNNHPKIFNTSFFVSLLCFCKIFEETNDEPKHNCGTFTIGTSMDHSKLTQTHTYLRTRSDFQVAISQQSRLTLKSQHFFFTTLNMVQQKKFDLYELVIFYLQLLQTKNQTNTQLLHSVTRKILQAPIWRCHYIQQRLRNKYRRATREVTRNRSLRAETDNAQKIRNYLSLIQRKPSYSRNNKTKTPISLKSQKPKTSIKVIQGFCALSVVQPNGMRLIGSLVDRLGGTSTSRVGLQNMLTLITFLVFLTPWHKA